MVLPIGLLIALWLAKKLLQYARQALNNARYRHQISDYIEYSDVDSEPDYIPDPEYSFPENETDPEQIVIVNERIERISGLIHDNYQIIAAIDKELSGTIKDARRTTLLTKKASIAEKIFRLEKQIDKERESL
jgi:hypothetical protein